MIQLLFGEIAKIEIGGTEDATQKGTFHFSEVLFSVNAPHFFVTRQKFIGVYWLYSKTFVPLFPIHSLLSYLLSPKAKLRNKMPERCPSVAG